MSDRHRQILDHMQTAVVVCDRTLHLTWLNAAAEQLLRTSVDRARGQPAQALFLRAEDLVDTLADALSAQQHLTRRDVSLRVGPTEEDITVDCTATPLTLESGGEDALLVELNALDRLKRLAREGAWLDVHTANQKVMRGLAHEVKNPLGGLRGAAQLLERQLPQEELREYTGIIISEADRLGNLVDRMAGPTQVFAPAALNIHRVTERVRTLLLADSATQVRIARDYDPSIPDLHGEEPLLIQAVLNLVKNAMEAVDGDGNVTLRTRIDRQITIGQVRHRHVLRLDVIDDGPGIDPDIADTIFYPMVTGRAQGTGLGLSITQDIVSRHGGLMEFVSQPGETRFSIYLPFTPPTEQTNDQQS